MDKYFVQGVQDDAAKCASIKALVQLAEVVESDRAIGIINRLAFMDRYAHPYQREVYGRRPLRVHRYRRILVLFNTQARELYDVEDIANGGIHGEDRHGNPAFFPVTTMSIGAVPASGSGRFRNHEEVASAAAAAKHQAKQAKSGLFILAP